MSHNARVISGTRVPVRAITRFIDRILYPKRGRFKTALGLNSTQARKRSFSRLIQISLSAGSVRPPCYGRSHATRMGRSAVRARSSDSWPPRTILRTLMPLSPSTLKQLAAGRSGSRASNTSHFPSPAPISCAMRRTARNIHNAWSATPPCGASGASRYQVTGWPRQSKKPPLASAVRPSTTASKWLAASYTFPVMLCHLGIFLGCPLMSESILLRTVWK